MKPSRLHNCAKQLALLFSSIVLISSCSGGSGGGDQGNALDVGFHTKAPESVSITLNGLMNYNGKSAEELYALRSRTVAKYSELVPGTYKPSSSVFTIDGKNPWWGIRGYMFRGRNISSTDGMSRESVFFGNPLVLVCPEFYGTNMHWSPQRFPKDEDFVNVFPTYLQPQSVKIFPKEQREEVVYDVMHYYNDVKAMMDGNWPISEIAFDIFAYNARDFGYNYLYIEPNKSSNISKMPPDVIAIEQVLGTKTRDSCAPSCNDIITPDALIGYKLKNLPAKCHILLWKSKPASHVTPEDFKIDLVFN